MKGYRFVHAADLHLDSPFRGVLSDAPQFRSVLRDATFRAYDAIVELCIAERVEALLIAGDIYDGADRSLRAQLHFVDGLQRLAAAGVRVFICHGNHDPLNGWEARIDFPPGVVRFGSEVSSAPFNDDDPESPIVYGISYPARDVYDNLVHRFPRPERDRFTIGLLHANVGSNTGHEPYAACSLQDLEASGFDYWALGHVHTRAVLRQKQPAVVYPGNPQGRHVGETGARGVYLVTVDGSGEPTLEFRAVDHVRWQRVAVDIGELDDEHRLLDRIDSDVEDARAGARGRPLVYRLMLQGRGPMHTSLRRHDFTPDLRKRLNDQFGQGDPFAFCERIDDATSPPIDRNAILQGPDVLADILRATEALRDDPGEIDALRDELRTLYDNSRARRYLGESTLATVEVGRLIEQAERLLLDEFLEGSAGR